MAQKHPKIHHPFVSYILMATFVIQVFFVVFNIYPFNSAETFVTLFFFLEGAYFYKRQGFVGKNAIVYAKGMFRQIRIPYGAIKKVRLSSRTIDSAEAAKLKERTIMFIITTNDGGEHIVPITPRLVEELKAHKIKIPKLKDISYFKLTYPSIDKIMVFEIVLLLIIWTVRFKNLSMMGPEPILGYQIIQGACGFFSGLLTIFFVHITTLRATFNKGHLKVRGFGAVRQDVDIKQITKVQIKDRGPLRQYIVYSDNRRVLSSGYLIGIGTLYAILADRGVEVDIPRDDVKQIREVSEIDVD